MSISDWLVTVKFTESKIDTVEFRTDFFFVQDGLCILYFISCKTRHIWVFLNDDHFPCDILLRFIQVIERVPISHIKEQIRGSSQHVGTLFLQLNVTDIGVAIPLMSDPTNRGGGGVDSENRGAIVCTVETTSISACSAQSMVSKGKFDDLCIRYGT